MPPLKGAARNADVHPATLWSDAPPFTDLPRTGTGMPDGPASFDTLGETLYPLFCVSVHEHAWIAVGYGVWGMETYLERFWSCLDYSKRWCGMRIRGARREIVSRRCMVILESICSYPVEQEKYY